MTSDIEPAGVDPAIYWSDGASGYERWWVPVLAPAVRGLLDRVAREGIDRGRGRRLLDLGTGTGALALEAARRWPDLDVVGVDVAPGMLRIAAQRAAAVPGVAARLTWVEGTVEALPFPDGQFDAVACAFVYQFLVDRGRALAEIHRVLRPGGTFAFVTWLAGPVPMMPADDAFEAVLGEMGLEWEGAEFPRGRRPRSPRSAARELRAAGFVNVRAREVKLVCRYDRATYLDQLEQDDATVTFANADPMTREEIRRRTRERWTALGDDAFVLERRLISVVATKPG